MNIPGDIDLTEARDFSEGVVMGAKHTPSKICPWERDEYSFYLNSNTISLINDITFPTRTAVTTNTSSRFSTSINFSYSNGTNTSSNSIMYKITNYKITNDDDLYFTTDMNPNRIWIDHTEGWLIRKRLTEEEIELEAMYADMPFSRDLFRYTFVSEELSASEQFIVPLISCIKYISKYQIEVESVIDEISPITFDDLLNTKVNEDGVWVRLHDRVTDELRKDNPYDKIIPWE